MLASPVRCAAGQAGPSRARRLPESALRSLVSLHHLTATFMRSPDQIPTAFEHTFRVRPAYQPATTLQTIADDTVARRGPALVSAYSTLDDLSTSVNTPGEYQRSHLVDAQRWTSPARYMPAAGPDTMGYRLRVKKSEREVRASEALWGTDERRDDGRREIGYEGIVEFVKERGMGSAEGTQAWAGGGDVGADAAVKGSPTPEPSRAADP